MRKIPFFSRLRSVGSVVRISMVFAGLSFSHSAFAICDGCVVAAVQAGSQAIVAAIAQLGTINASAITNSSNNQVNQANTAQAEQIKNGMNMKYEIAPTACANAAITQGVSSVMSGSPARGGAGGGAPGGGTPPAPQPNDQLTNLIKVDKGQVRRPTPEAMTQTQAQGACQGYASTTNMRGVMCQMAGFNPAGATYIDADVSAETLFDGPQNTTDITKMKQHLTIKQNTKEYAAIEMYLHNLDQPLELRDLSKSELQTNAGARYLALHDMYAARMSMANKPARDWVGDSTADQRLVNVINQMMQNDPSNGTATFVQNYLSDSFPSWGSDGISVHQLLDLEGQRRYLNGQWYNSIAQASPDAVARESVMIGAAQNYLLTQLLFAQQKTNVMLGQVLAATERQEFQPQLMAAHRAATGGK